MAKGAGAIAAKIRARGREAPRARWSRDVPLARALYAACEVGQEIPAELFAAVAQVLAFVMALRTRGSRRPALHHRPGPLAIDAGSRRAPAIAQVAAAAPADGNVARTAAATGARTVDPST